MLRRTKIAALEVLWLLPTLIFAAAFSDGWIPAWRSVGAPAMLPRFADLVAIPYGVQALHHGLYPLVSNPADPPHRTVNYPRIWLYLFSALGMTAQNVWLVALLFCAFYLLRMRDYRLIFLLPTMPFALRVLRSEPQLKLWAMAFLVLVGIAENALRLGVPGNPLRMERHGGTFLAHFATLQLFFLLLTVLAYQVKTTVLPVLPPISRTTVV